jgi:hypothetical protein
MTERQRTARYRSDLWARRFVAPEIVARRSPPGTCASVLDGVDSVDVVTARARQP